MTKEEIEEFCAQHSALPWNLNHAGKIYDAEGNKVAVPIDRGADAELIVRAVNSHAELVSALEEIITICTESMGDCRKRMGTRVGNAAVVARKALANAKR